MKLYPLYRGALTGAVICLSLAACSSTEVVPEPVPDAEVDSGESVFRWWDSPGDVGDNIAVVGTAKLNANMSMVRTVARQDGSQQIAGMLATKVQGLITAWSQETGDYLKEGSLQTLAGNESYTLGVIDQEISGARAIAYHKEGGYLYCLMIVDNIGGLVQQVKTAISTKVIQDETYWKIEARKTGARKELEAVLDANLEREQAAMAASQEAFMQKVEGNER